MKISEVAADTGKKMRGVLVKCLTVVLIAIISIMLLNVMSRNRDGRHSVISAGDSNEYINSAGTDEEIRLKNILECIEGVGEVNVMISGSEDEEETASVFSSSVERQEEKGGVIVVAEGGGDPNVKSRIVDAVSVLRGIEPAEVVVFELRG